MHCVPLFSLWNFSLLVISRRVIIHALKHFPLSIRYYRLPHISFVLHHFTSFSFSSVHLYIIYPSKYPPQIWSIHDWVLFFLKGNQVPQVLQRSLSSVSNDFMVCCSPRPQDFGFYHNVGYCIDSLKSFSFDALNKILWSDFLSLLIYVKAYHKQHSRGTCFFYHYGIDKDLASYGIKKCFKMRRRYFSPANPDFFLLDMKCI